MKKILLLALVAISLGACKSNDNASAYYTYETRCLGVEGDGSQTLLAWGDGKDKKDAVEQALKNAVSDVIFKGINEGKSECTKIPLLNTPNARQKYDDYFNKFFADGGEYRKFVNLKDEKSLSRDTEKHQYGRKVSVTVRVLRPELKKKLQNDGILPK